MSTKWHGGKGDKNRTSNYNAYVNNYDKIFTENKHTSVVGTDLWGFARGQVDLIEGDTIEWKKVDYEVIIEVVKEAPFKWGEASGNAGKPFRVSEDYFNCEIKPHLKSNN